MKGWIKLHRKIKNHWLWDDPEKLKRWITILLEVNYTEAKMLLGNNLIEVKRGSSTNSIRTWSALFKCGSKATTNFFDLLESDGMISRKTLGKGKHSTTLISITNYEEYQTEKETLVDTITSTLTHTQEKLKQPTIEEVKKDNNVKEISKSLLSEIDISDVPPDLQDYFKIALSFQKLFIKNLKVREAPTRNQELARFNNYVTPIRLMIENDNITRDQIKLAYDFLQSKEGEFWKSNILSTKKLREKIDQLISQKNTPKRGYGISKPMDEKVRTKIAQYD